MFAPLKIHTICLRYKNVHNIHNEALEHGPKFIILLMQLHIVYSIVMFYKSKWLTLSFVCSLRREPILVRQYLFYNYTFINAEFFFIRNIGH